MTASSSVEYLAKLVAFRSVSRDSNLDLIDFVRREAETAGATCRLIASEDGHKANLFATIGPADRQGIMLSGHSDVVPTEGQAWSSDPFTLRKAEGRLFARGSADMKGFLACCLTMLRNVRERRLAQPLHLAVSYDEEVGCLGVRRLIDMMEGLPVRPRFCIVGEPTSLQVVTAHKGKVGMRVACRGLEAHSSIAPTTVNAVHLACDLIAQIRAIQAGIAASRDQRSGLCRALHDAACRKHCRRRGDQHRAQPLPVRIRDPVHPRRRSAGHRPAHREGGRRDRRRCAAGVPGRRHRLHPGRCLSRNEHEPRQRSCLLRTRSSPAATALER